MKRLIVIYGPEFSRKGGIEDVCLNTLHVLQKYYWVIKIDNQGSRLFKLLKVIFVNIFSLIPKVNIFFMHPFLFQKMMSPLCNSFVWCYGVDIWGNYGKSAASKLPRATRVVTISKFTQEQISENFPNLLANIVNLPVTNVKFAKADRTTKLESQRTKSNFRLVTISRLTKSDSYKGHRSLFSAVKKLTDSGRDVHLDVIGDGDDAKDLQDYTELLGINSIIKFHGYLNEDRKSEILASSDLFVLFSKVEKREHERWDGEGLGLVYIEAANHGLPSVAYFEGGQTDFIHNRHTGVLVANEDELIDAIASLCDDTKFLKAMSENAIIQAQKYTFETFESQVVSLIETSIKN